MQYTKQPDRFFLARETISETHWQISSYYYSSRPARLSVKTKTPCRGSSAWGFVIVA